MKLVTKNSESDNNYFLNEIYILRKLDHPNILKIYEYFSNEKYWYFIMFIYQEENYIKKMQYAIL